jgi:MarR family transcriptional regulator for hemolysin
VLEYDFDQSVGYWLTVTTQAFHRAIQHELAPYGITYRQLQVLSWLALEGEMSQIELAGKMMIEPPTLVGVLDRMERDGWISRRICAADRRRKLVRAMPEAEPAWETIVQCARRVRARATEGITPRQLATVKKVLGRVRRNLAAASPAAMGGD